jgi:hypothetical protein
VRKTALRRFLPFSTENTEFLHEKKGLLLSEKKGLWFPGKKAFFSRIKVALAPSEKKSYVA